MKLKKALYQPNAIAVELHVNRHRVADWLAQNIVPRNVIESNKRTLRFYHGDDVNPRIPDLLAALTDQPTLALPTRATPDPREFNMLMTELSRISGQLSTIIATLAQITRYLEITEPDSTEGRQ